MQVEVKKVERDGAVLSIIQKDREGEKVWLPGEEWSGRPDDWDRAYEGLEKG